MDISRVVCDLNNCDVRGRVRLTCAGTLRDLQAQQIELRDGLVLPLYDDGDSDPLIFDGRVEFSHDEKIWVAVFDYHQIRNLSKK